MSEIGRIDLTMNDGSHGSLDDWRGKVVLLVNVASKCGLTGQYEGLEALYRARKDDGLVVLGVPSNDFKEQEPGTDAEVLAFCQGTYGVTFPLAAKTPVSGAVRHPLYAALIAAKPAAEGEGPWREKLAGYGITANPAPEVQWNFEKFLIGRDGRVVGRFAPDVAADDPRLTAAIDRALAEA
ncbi:glutathione peroxidase [Paracoccus sanguinis]|uniref:Glutathione peroxidase n=1 Tax=Paracoccus sanguinis TaxID=1545044 RepID=A0A1H2WW90_9RHOB|nr:glutathione peroxidase [Paracoccus sanguinis]KGJ17201.1 glutathione peroxidase [Paracoccus sanguinis]SDW84778.1 glutathione peroxidase [Paracoccus sanguinis]